MRNLTILGLMLATFVPILALKRLQDRILAEPLSRAEPGTLVHGRVVGTDDHPIAGVTVQDFPWFRRTKSIGNGEFLLFKAFGMVRFSIAGFRPQTVTVGSLLRDSRVVLVEDRRAIWNVPECSQTSTRSVMTGDFMQVTLPVGIQRHHEGIDAQRDTVCRRGSCMNLDYGPTWGLFDLVKFLQGLRGVQERELLFGPNLYWIGYEYRGVRNDGTRARLVIGFGDLPETILYDHGSTEAAEFFDTIIDTVCAIREPWHKGKLVDLIVMERRR
jgi:hypothetical protein